MQKVFFIGVLAFWSCAAVSCASILQAIFDRAFFETNADKNGSGSRTGCSWAKGKFLSDQNEIDGSFQQLLEFVKQKGRETEGIFRVSGSLPKIQALWRQMEEGSQVDYSQLDEHDAACLLKLLMKNCIFPLANDDDDDFKSLLSLLQRKIDFIKETFQ